MYRELKEQPKLGEQAIVPDNGLRNGYTVDFKLLNSKTYHNRFEKLTPHKAFSSHQILQQVGRLLRRVKFISCL